MVRFAELLIAFKEYPHTDALERAFELVDLCVAMAQGRIRPVAALADPRMIGVIHTTRQPGRGLVDRVQALEGHDGVLCISLVHGFPWGDVPDMGAKVLVYTDGDADKAHSIASRLADELFGLREQLVAPYPNIDTALDEALAFNGGPVVLADSADNVGGRSAPEIASALILPAWTPPPPCCTLGRWATPLPATPLDICTRPVTKAAKGRQRTLPTHRSSAIERHWV